MDDNSRRLGVLVWKLANGQVSNDAAELLLQMCRALDANDMDGAQAIWRQFVQQQVLFDECQDWVTALKRLIKYRQQLG